MELTRNFTYKQVYELIFRKPRWKSQRTYLGYLFIGLLIKNSDLEFSFSFF